MENKIQIITYADSMGGDLRKLELILDKHFKNVIGSVHILPFYPSSGDRGFAPLTHLEVDPKFGNWEDVKRISEKYTVMADLMVNHISIESKYFQDYINKGDESKYADYFITNDKFSRRILPRRKERYIILDFIEKVVNKIRDIDVLFHSTGVNKFSLRKIYRPRSESPFVPFLFRSGAVEHLWCTFTKEQVDLDVYNDDVKKLLEEYIAKLSENGVNMIRFDAVGYLIKKRGTNSFMLPETIDFINWLGKIAHKNGTLALPEIHNHYSYQEKLSNLKEVDYVYDFQIPVLTLHAIYNKNFSILKKWLKIRPNNIITVLDTHDGLPIVDLEDLLTKDEIEKTSEEIIARGGNETKRASGDNGYKNVDTYQINCTYYSALDEDDDSYIVARAIQFFIPGVPQVYYVGLLAGENDVEKLKKTNIGRDINRHDYSVEEIELEMNRDIVKRLIKLMDFRNNYPVFDGKFSVARSDNDKLMLRWIKDDLFLNVDIDLSKMKVRACYLDVKSKNEKVIVF